MSEIARKQRFTDELCGSQRQIYGYIFALLCNKEDAQEVFQQTCLTMWEKFDEFEGRSAFATWGCAIARNKVRDFFKSRRRYSARFSPAFEESLAAIVAQVSAEEIDGRRAALDECLKKLTSDERNLAEQFYGAGVTAAKLAARWRCTPTVIYGKLRKIRETLLRCIDRTLAEAAR